MKHSHAERPSWIWSDRQIDITDFWLEQVDPENETGVVAIAHLKADSDGLLEVSGVAIKDLGVTLYYDRKELINQIGIDQLWHLEALEFEACGDPDALYDDWRQNQIAAE